MYYQRKLTPVYSAFKILLLIFYKSIYKDINNYKCKKYKWRGGYEP